MKYSHLYAISFSGGHLGRSVKRLSCKPGFLSVISHHHWLLLPKECGNRHIICINWVTGYWDIAFPLFSLLSAAILNMQITTLQTWLRANYILSLLCSLTHIMSKLTPKSVYLGDWLWRYSCFRFILAAILEYANLTSFGKFFGSGTVTIGFSVKFTVGMDQKTFVVGGGGVDGSQKLEAFWDFRIRPIMLSCDDNLRYGRFLQLISQ